jgi:PAS domain S-box-containing protein
LNGERVHGVRSPAAPPAGGILADRRRLATLRRLALVDSPAEESFDRLTRLAARVLRAPVALVSFVEEDRQFIKSSVGLPEPLASRREMPLSHSFCHLTVERGEPLVVEDARRHPDLRDHPAVRLRVIAYAGIPLFSSDGLPLGTLCVVDSEPRRWNLEGVGILEDLAASVMTEIELRTAVRRAHQKAEEAERERRDRIAVLDRMSEGFLVLDRGLRVTHLNRSAEALVGRSRDDVVGREIWEVIGRTEGSDVALELRRAMEEECAVHFQTRSSRNRWIEAHAYPEADGLSVFIRDITEQKAIETALRAREEELRQAQKMEALGRLAGGVAHDFNNLLTVIRGHVDLLVQGLDPESPLQDDVDEIRTAADRATALTRQLLSFSRRQTVQATTVDLNRIVAGMEKMLHRLIGEDIALVTSLDASLGKVNADPGHLEQVLMNLVVNARDAMPQGGTIRIETRNAELGEEHVRRYPYVQPGPYVLLAVTDTGAGMDEETRSKIFEPFFTTKEPGKGTGLGLSTVYAIVKQSGGYIWVSSELGAGTTFRIYLPRFEGEIEPAPAPAPKPSSSPGNETILLVEDEVSIRRLARRVLEKLGYTVLEATNGADALEVAGRYPGRIHLLVTDVVMPEMSGPRLAEVIAMARPGIQVLYTSGYTEHEIVHRGAAREGISFLEKPFTPEMLGRKVREVLDGGAD